MIGRGVSGGVGWRRWRRWVRVVSSEAKGCDFYRWRKQLHPTTWATLLPQSRRFRAVCGEKDYVFLESAEQIGSVESTHVLKDPFKVGTVTGGPLRLQNVGTLSHVQPLRNEGSERWSSTNEGFRGLFAHSDFRFCTCYVSRFSVLQYYRICFTKRDFVLQQSPTYCKR